MKPLWSLWIASAGVGSEDSDSDALYRVHMTTAGVTTEGPYSVGRRPSYMCWAGLDGRQPLLVVAHETSDGFLSAWRAEGEHLHRVGDPVSTGGASPCHVAADPRNRVVYAANYRGGSVAAFDYSPKGLGELRALVQFDDATHRSSRQRAPHPHQVVIDSEREQLLVPDLGADVIRRLPFPPQSRLKSWSSLPPISLHSGAGPRHLVINGNRAYCLNELDGTVSVIDLGAPHDDAEELFVPSSNRHTSLRSEPSAIRLSVNGSLVTAQRGIDTISWLRADHSGLEVVREEPAGGLHPRDLLVFDDDDVFVALRLSDSVRRLSRATGANDELVAVHRPACLLFDPA